MNLRALIGAGWVRCPECGSKRVTETLDYVTDDTANEVVRCEDCGRETPVAAVGVNHE